MILFLICFTKCIYLNFNQKGLTVVICLDSHARRQRIELQLLKVGGTDFGKFSLPLLTSFRSSAGEWGFHLWIYLYYILNRSWCLYYPFFYYFVIKKSLFGLCLNNPFLTCKVTDCIIFTDNILQIFPVIFYCFRIKYVI